MSDRTASAASQQREQTEQKQMQIAIAEREAKIPLKEVTRLSSVFSNQDFIKRLEQAVPKQLTANRMLRSLLGSVQRSPDLLKCEILDVVGKMLVCASAGLETDTPLGHAHLIPFESNVWNPKTRQREKKFVCQVIFGYHGLLDLSYRTGMLGTINARCVWKDEEDSGHFSFEFGTSRHLRHKPLGGKARDLSPEAQIARTAQWPAWVYAHATMKDGYGDPFEVLPWADVVAIRDRAQAYRSAINALERGQKAQTPYVPATYTEAPWVRHVQAMAAKTTFRRLSNWLPRSIEMATVTAIEEAQERGHYDFGPVIDSTDYMATASEVVSTGDPGSGFGVRDTNDDADGGDGAAQTGADQQSDKKTPAKATTASAPPKAADKPPTAKREAEPPSDDSYIPPGDAVLSGTRRASDTASVPAATTTLRQEAERVATDKPDTTDLPGATEYWPTDEHGNPAVDGAGEAMTFADPTAAAEWFAAALAAASNPQALRENNMDMLADAHEDTGAAAIIDVALAKLREAPNQDALQPPETTDPIIPVPNGRNGKPHWGNYMALSEQAIGKLTTGKQLEAWEDANKPSYAEMKVVVAKVAQMLEARRKVLALAPRQDDRDERTSEDFRSEIAKCKDRLAFDEFERMMAFQTVMRRWQRERPDLYKLTMDAATAKIDSFKPGLAGDPT